MSTLTLLIILLPILPLLGKRRLNVEESRMDTEGVWALVGVGILSAAGSIVLGIGVSALAQKVRSRVAR